MSGTKLRRTTTLFGVLALRDVASVNLAPVLVEMVLSLCGEAIISLATTTWFGAVDLVGKVNGGEMAFKVGGTSEAAFTPRLQAVVCAFQSKVWCVSLLNQWNNFPGSLPCRLLGFHSPGRH